MTPAALESIHDHAIDAAMAMAVRLAVRGHGRVEPNPMVGCVVLDRHGVLAGWGFHRRIGGDHAEVEALRRAGGRARGGTLVVTLEPCNHHGRTPPCVDAIERAGVARVIYAEADPNPVATGGAVCLRAKGVTVDHRPHMLAASLNAPFVRRVTTGMPWVCAKWAQTIDGAIAARSGESRWISSERLRRMVHRERGRVDALLTGIGTVLADDPLLTPRSGSIRRMPLRVVVDPELSIASDAAIVRSAGRTAPVVIAALDSTMAQRPSHAASIRREGIEIVAFDGSMRTLLKELASAHGITRILVESGGGLLGRLEREGLIDEWWVIVAPRLSGDAQAPRPIRGFEPASPTEMLARSLAGVWRRGDEMMLLYRRAALA